MTHDEEAPVRDTPVPPRPGDLSRGRHPRRGVPGLARSRTPRRAPRVQALLGGRAPQPRGDREQRHRGAHGLHRRQHREDPRGLRGHHASQPCPARRGRADRHARVDLSGSHRPGPRARPRHRSAHDARAAQALHGRGLRRQRGGARVVLRARGAGPGGARHSRRGPRGADLDPGARACTARTSPPTSGGRTPSLPTSRPATCWRRSPSTAPSSSPRRSSRSPS